MIFGIGIDIIEVRRIKNAIEKTPGFLERIFTEKEIQYLESRNLRAEYVAGRYAAKEAVAKSMGTGFRDFKFKDIEIESTILGKPIVFLNGNAKILAQKHGNYKIHLSISHGIDNAIAYAIMEVINSEDWNCKGI